MLCDIHLVQMAVDPHTGKYATDPRAVRPAGYHGPNDPGNPHGLSSEGMCKACYDELRSGGYYPCPIHGVQPVAKRESDGNQCCPVCGKTSEEVAAEMASKLAARAPAIRQQVAKEEAAWLASMSGVPADGMERRSGVLENAGGPWEGSEAGPGTGAERTRQDGQDPPEARGTEGPQVEHRGLHGGGREGHGDFGTGTLVHR